ncbi:putative immunity protein [Methanolapillus ohkumae]|uniref:Imm-5-like domain-containing protein n=1 Tax=Methanolapillus ohkumae TaxID=3028298 RepID=A0AA96V6N2_9EURY|nr:hypothetical protein MsAm2_02670 [Methanosarcinaceae archaeon Am2]
MVSMKKLLFTRESACIQPIRELIEQQNHRTLVLWALDSASFALNIFESRSDDLRPRQAVEAAGLWASGSIKMPDAKKAILACHKAATESGSDPVTEAAARAVGHAAATVHVETHALGLVFYGLTAAAYAKCPYTMPNDAEALVADELDWFYERLTYWEIHAEDKKRSWAPFLLKDSPNKEKLFRQKQEQKMKNKV